MNKKQYHPSSLIAHNVQERLLKNNGPGRKITLMHHHLLIVGSILGIHSEEHIWADSKALSSTERQQVNITISRCKHWMPNLGFHPVARCHPLLKKTMLQGETRTQWSREIWNMNRSMTYKPQGNCSHANLWCGHLTMCIDKCFRTQNCHRTRRDEQYRQLQLMCICYRASVADADDDNNIVTQRQPLGIPHHRCITLCLWRHSPLD